MTLLFWATWTMAAVMAATVISIWAVRSREATLRAAHGDVVRAAKQGAAHVGSILGVMDDVLIRLAAGTSEAELNSQSFDRLCPSFLCADYSRPEKGLLIAFARSNGEVVLAGSNPPPASLADRDYFAALKEADVGLAIGKPRRNRVVDGTYLPIGRRLAPGEQGFHGIVAAAINTDLIRVFFHGLGIETVDRIDLRDRQGSVLVGWPAPTDTANVQSGCGAAPDAPDIIEASEHLKIGGLSVDVCRSPGNALRHWRQQVLLAAGGASLVLLAPALAFPAIRRRWERRLRQQLGLRGLVAGSSDVQFIVAAKPNGTFVLEALTFSQGGEWSGMSARLVGRTTRELFPADEADLVDADYRAVLASGETRRIERRIRLGGTQFVWSTLLVPLRDAGGGYIFGAASDLGGDAPLEGGLRGFTESVLRREDNERRRIARELHDTTGQNLIAAGFELEAVARSLVEAPPQVHAALAEARRLVEVSVAELRTLSYVLYPPLLDEAGLGLALTTLAEGFGKRAGLCVTVSVAREVAGRRWGAEIELALYRVAQEALTNVQRHTSAKAAHLDLRAGAPARLELTVENDAGEAASEQAPADPIAEGTGIRGMRDRLAALGGSLTVMRREKAFRVTATVPVEPVTNPAR